MDVSYTLGTQFAPSRSLDGIAEELVYQTELLHDGGFYCLFVPEHHATDDSYLYNEAVVSYLANHVGDMTLGTGVRLLPFHNPVRIAQFGATVDHLTGGGFRLGVAQGIGPRSARCSASTGRRRSRGSSKVSRSSGTLDRGPDQLRGEGVLVRRRDDRPEAPP
jgi:alkanesulfonate monooxygenase SsuD/methylene tetrahydromethanopterin reductase-like flavin-dependent oxidoreductase (luciferase family)